ncbi:hypothetical protein ABT095_15735 [Kitasatospora sp. NPDC002227]|uniref:hypothetical protein n=1 Tax=Kitasatospora sp. NPDC002227 TaxID=3154773 RepID=UPI00332486B3
MSTRRKPPRAQYKPTVGELVIDAAHKGVEGVYMGVHAGKAHLRPEAGGKEWTTDPGALESPFDKPKLVLRLKPDTRYPQGSAA